MGSERCFVADGQIWCKSLWDWLATVTKVVGNAQSLEWDGTLATPYRGTPYEVFMLAKGFLLWQAAYTYE